MTTAFAKPGNIGTKVYETSLTSQKLRLPSDYPFLVSEAELAVLVNEKYVENCFYNRMYLTIDEYVLGKNVTVEMVERRIGHSVVYATQTYLESQDGQ